MVKNTVGGKHGKSISRKGGTKEKFDFDINDPLIRIACVNAIMGGAIAQASFYHSGHMYTSVCHIRGKFRGRAKRFNLISKLSFVFIQFRHFDNFQDYNMIESDIVHVFQSIDDVPSSLQTEAFNLFNAVNGASQNSTMAAGAGDFTFTNDNTPIVATDPTTSTSQSGTSGGENPFNATEYDFDDL